MNARNTCVGMIGGGYKIVRDVPQIKKVLYSQKKVELEEKSTKSRTREIKNYSYRNEFESCPWVKNKKKMKTGL